mgnify:CR=1 FL=1
MNLVNLYKTDNAILYYNDSILYLNVITNKLIIHEIKTFIEYIINFLNYCNKKNINISIYYNFNYIKLNNIPVFDIFTQTKSLFLNLTPNDTKCIKCYVILLNNKLLKQSIKTITKIIKPLKPWKITKSQEKAEMFIESIN